MALRLKGEVQHHDGVLLHDAKQHDHAHKAIEVQVHAEQPERAQRAEARRGQAGKNGQGMDETFVQNAQHQIDDHNGQHQQPAHARERALKSLGRALGFGGHRVGQQRLRGGLHGGDALPQRHAGAQVVRNGHRGELTVVVHGNGPHARLHFDQGIQGHEVAVGGAHIEARQGRTVLLKFFLQFHKNRVVVGGRVDGGYFTRAVGRLERQVYLVRADAQGRRAVAINGNAQFGVFQLQVAVHVLYLRQGAQGVLYLLGAVVEVFHIRAGKRVLIQRLGRAPAQVDGRGHPHKDPHGGRDIEFAPQLLRHLIDAGPLCVGFERHEQNAVVHAGAAAHNAHNGIVHGQMGIFFQQGVEAALRADHALVGYALLRLGAGHQHAHIFHGQKALGHGHADPDRERQQSQRGHQRFQTVVQHHVQRAGIQCVEAVKAAFKPAVEALPPAAASLVRPLRLEKVGAEHGRQRERHHARSQNGRDDDHGELPEQTPHNAAHKEYGDEDRSQGNRHGHDGEADFRRTVVGRGERILAHLLVAHDVFEHDDGVVHHKAHGQGERHEREVVQAVAKHRHDRKGGYDRHGQGKTGNDRGGQVAQKNKDDEHNQKNGEHQRKLNICHGMADGFRTVVKNLQRYGRRQLALQPRHQRADGVHHLHGVGAGLAFHGQGNARRAAVAPGDLLVLLDAVHHLPDVAQAHGRAVAVGHHRILKGAGVEQLPGGLDGAGPLLALQRARGQHAVGGGHGVGHFVNAKPARGHLVRVKLHAHGVLFLPVHHHLGHAFHHGEPLPYEGVGIFVEGVQRQG